MVPRHRTVLRGMCRQFPRAPQTAVIGEQMGKTPRGIQESVDQCPGSYSRFEALSSVITAAVGPIPPRMDPVAEPLEPAC